MNDTGRSSEADGSDERVIDLTDRQEPPAATGPLRLKERVRELVDARAAERAERGQQPEPPALVAVPTVGPTIVEPRDDPEAEPAVIGEPDSFARDIEPPVEVYDEPEDDSIERRLAAGALVAAIAILLILAVVLIAEREKDSPEPRADTPRAGTAPDRSRSGGSGDGAVSAATAAAVAAWITDNVAPSARVLAPEPVAAALRSSGRWPGQIVPPDDADETPVDIAVGVSGADALDAAAPTERSLRLAGFADGDRTVEVREVAPGDVDTADERLQLDLDARRAAGAALASNPRVRATPGASAVLRAGQVDARLLSVLAGLSATHTFDVDAFPIGPETDPTAPRRTARLSDVDGDSAPAGATTTAEQWLQAQRAPFRPTSATTADGSLEIRYLAPSPLGVLDLPVVHTTQ